MKKIIYIFIFLVNLVSCNINYNEFNIYVGMSKKEITEHSLINEENYIDLEHILLISIDEENYVVELDDKNKVINFNIYKEPKFKKRKLEGLYLSLEKNDFNDLVSNYGFPNVMYTYNDDEKIKVWYILDSAKEYMDVNRSITILYLYDLNNKPIFKKITTSEYLHMNVKK